MRFYLTTAIDYVNSRPHLGTAYEKVAADVIARYHRLRGSDTWFVMGNDEHSQNVYRRAKELGETPLDYCNRMEGEFRDTWAKLDVSFDDFIRTTEPRHRVAVQQMVGRIADAGDLYEGFYEGWYCVSCEAFKQEKDLIDGACPIHKVVPQWIREKNHFFRLSKYQTRLLDHFREHPSFLEPDIRRNEILRLLESGLEDISVSRAGQSWGIPLPFDPNSVVYVWFDALINYISAVGYGTDQALFDKWWPANLHVIGKDITRFHTVVWPAMLMSAGVELPRQVFGHGWLHLRGEKMSKSLGTALDPGEAAARFGPDPLRLYLAKEIPFGGDGDFTWERFEDRYNVDLANNLGNLVSRVAAMVDKYRQGELSGAVREPGRLAAVARDAVKTYESAMDVFAIHEACAAAFKLIDATNEFIAETEPWALARDAAQADRLTQALVDVVEAVRIAAVLLLPVMPRSASEILVRMGETRPVKDVRFHDAQWTTSATRRVSKGDALWPRYDTAPPQASVEGRTVTEQNPPAPIPATPPPAAAPAAAPAPSADDRLSIDDFMKVDLRVARVLEAERVPNSKKLVKLKVDLGTEQRTVVAGIAEAYEAAALVGRTIVMITNLKPAKLMGIESNGMVLAATREGGQPQLLAFEGEAPPPGSRVR